MLGAPPLHAATLYFVLLRVGLKGASDCADGFTGCAEPATSKVSHAQAYIAFETALTWLEAQGDTDPAHNYSIVVFHSFTIIFNMIT